MIHREQKVKELMESFHSLRRSMAFKPTRATKMPRITPSQWGVLMLIGRPEESTVKDVAKALRISSSAATQLIDGLVVSGYVVREEHAEDRRRVMLTLSSKTKSQFEKMKKQSVERFLKFFEALNDKEFDQYIALNKKIVERLSKNKRYGH
jgi:DNA-binding MarR family transcriptional regulator